MPLTFNAFPKPDPSDNGLNNAAILAFTKDPLNSLIKEMTQNSIDALPDGEKKVRVRIKKFDIVSQDIPNKDVLIVIFDNLIEYWRIRKQTEFSNYFRNAQEILKRDEISAFAFEDFNTKGLFGDTAGGDFKLLIMDEGAQGDKPAQGALGGFGIGKNAFFNLTPLQTVFYTSLNDEGIKFMGVSKLAEYKDRLGNRKSNRIYYGNWKEGDPLEPDHLDFIKVDNEVPEIFRRTEYGLSSFAIGAKVPRGWTNLVKQALVRNYWYRFLNDSIEAEIIDDEGNVEIINKENFESLSEEVFKDQQDKSVLAYISAFKNPQIDGVFEKEIKQHDFGKIKIHLIEQPDDSYEFPDKVLYIRDGMMIKQENKDVGQLPKKLAGVIFCDSIRGNEILSWMEPPAHDQFEPNRLSRKSKKCCCQSCRGARELNVIDGELILTEIKKAKKEAINKLKEKYTISSSSSELVDEILSGFSDPSASGTGTGKTSTSDREEYYRRKTESIKSTDSISPIEVSVISDQAEPSGRGAGTDGGSGNGKSGPGSRKGDGGVGPDEGVGKGGSGNLGGGSGKRKAIKRKDAEISVTFFFDKKENSLNHYIMVIRTDKDLYNTYVSFSQFGDDGNSTPTSRLVNFIDSLGLIYNFEVVNNVFTVRGLNLLAGTQNVFYLSFEEIKKSAFKFIDK